jgi:hypothetical protein
LTLEASPKGVKPSCIYGLLNRGWYPPRLVKEARSRLGKSMLSFQLIGWVLILLFFGAMIGGHKNVADR